MHILVPLLSLCMLTTVPEPSATPSRQLKQPSSAPLFLGFRPQLGPKSFDVTKKLGLRPLRDGGYLYQGRKDEKFDARILPDGSVEFRDAGAFAIKTDALCFSVVCPIASPAQVNLKKGASKKDIAARQRRRKIGRIATRVALGILAGGIPLAGMDNSGVFGQGGLSNAQARPGSQARGLFYASGRFGRTGIVAVKKMKFLDETRSFRLELAVVAQESYMRRALVALAEELGRIERSTSADTIRRQQLLRLWERFDVAYEEPKLKSALAQRVDQSMGTKLRFAKKQMLAFANRMFPKTSKKRFSSAELEAFNQELPPAEQFKPYGK